MNGKCNIHGTELTSAGTCWRCVGENREPPAFPCPNCASIATRLKEAEDVLAKANARIRDATGVLHRAAGEKDAALALLRKARR